MITSSKQEKIERLNEQLILLRALYGTMIEREAQFDEVKKVQQQIREIERSLEIEQTIMKMNQT